MMRDVIRVGAGITDSKGVEKTGDTELKLASGGLAAGLFRGTLVIPLDIPDGIYIVGVYAADNMSKRG